MRRNLAAEPSVSHFEYEPVSKTLTIEGDNFEDRGCGNPDISVEFAQLTCKIHSSTLTKEFIECTIESSPVAGSHTVIVRDSCGSFDVSHAGMVDIDLMIHTISPTQISQLG